VERTARAGYATLTPALAAGEGAAYSRHVEGEGGRAPLWLLPSEGQRLPSVRRERLGLGLILSGVALAAAAPAYVYLAPPSTWGPESLLIVLLIVSFASYSAAVEIRSQVTFDASFVASLVALVFLGPLPAACVLAAPEICAWIERRRIMSLLGDTAGALWGALAGAWVLQALSAGLPSNPDPEDFPAVALAGGALLVAGYLVTTLLVSVVWERLRLVSLARQELKELAPISAGMILAGTLSVLLYEELGLPGLLPLAFLVLLPRAVVPRLAQSRNPAKLDRCSAIGLYAEAISETLGLGAEQRRVLLDASTHPGGAARLTKIGDFQRVMQTVLYCHEHWDGQGGFPGILRGEAIPIESRVLAVAEQLGSLTAIGTRGLSPEQAVFTLVPHAGGVFDPRVVSAARRVIEEDILVSRRLAPARGADLASAG
jgi:HD domain